MTTKEIRYVDYGIANNMGEFIEVNEDLKKYPKLFKAIMQHELAHTDIQGFNKEDFLVDMEETNINYWELLKFMCKYPRSFMQLAPFYKKNNVFYYDINMIVTWIFSIAVVGFIVYLLA